MSEAVDYLLGEMEPDRAARFEARARRDADAASRGRASAPDRHAARDAPRRRVGGRGAAAAARVRGRGHHGAVARRARAGLTRAGRAAPAPPPRLVLRPAVAALCAVALLAAGIGLGVLLDRDPEPATRLVLSPIEGVDPGASGRVGVTSDRVNVRVSGLPPTADGQFYEMWLLGADKQLVGLGSFQVGEDGMATLKLPLPVDPGQFSYFDISLEPGDGDPGHSGVSVLRGPTV